jgi:hypothetical protein
MEALLKICLIIGFFSFPLFQNSGGDRIFAQESSFSKIDSLAYLLAFSDHPEKSAALDQVLELLEAFLNKDFPLSSPPMEFLTTAVADDQMARVVSGLLKLPDGGYDYYSIIDQLEEGVLNRKMFIGGVSKDFFNIDLIELRKDECFGAIYYQIVPFLLNSGRKAYLLLGLNLWSEEERRKVVEAFSFQNGEFVYGLPVFVKKGENKPLERIVIQYSTISTAGLRYDKDLEQIILDHLILAPHPYSKYDVVTVPDGTYETFHYKNGLWHWKELLPFEPQGTLPNPRPNSSTHRDLFGRKLRK